jgi:hypothetical protein
MAMFLPSVGEGMPDVTVPIRVLPEGANILAPSAAMHQLLGLFQVSKGYARRAGAPSTIRPTRRLGGPSLRCFLTPSAPMKPPVDLRSFPITILSGCALQRCQMDAPMTQVNPASTGVVSSSRSLPYRHIPASRRRLSRAPRPVSCTGGLDNSLAISIVCDGGIEI